MLELPFTPGMRAHDVLNREFPSSEHELIMTVVNGDQLPHHTLLHDGDTVELLLPMVGG